MARRRPVEPLSELDALHIRRQAAGPPPPGPCLDDLAVFRAAVRRMVGTAPRPKVLPFSRGSGRAQE